MSEGLRLQINRKLGLAWTGRDEGTVYRNATGSLPSLFSRRIDR